MLTTQEKEAFAGAFTEAGKRMDGLEDTIQELIRTNDKTAYQLNKYAKALMSASMQAGDYLGFWPSEEAAKAFGGLVLGVLGQKALGEGTQVGGGVLVPEELATRIIQKLGIYGKFRRNALTLLLGSDRQLVPKVESDLTIYCPGEGNEITESDVTFSQVGLTPKKFCCLCKVSSELEEDSVIAIGEILGISMTRSMAKKEDVIGFVGDGTETYFGMTGIVGALRAVDETIGNIKGLVVASGNVYSEITLGDFEGVVAILPEDVDDDAKWYMNKKFYYNVVYPLARTAGVANIYEILSDKKGRYLYGYPVEFVSAMPSTEANSQICAVLGDLKMGAYLGQRRDLTVARSTDVFFKNDQVAVRGIERIDINAFGVGDTTEPGPIVALITAPS